MSTCPNGHQSATDDFCDTCGAPITPSTSSPPAPAGVPAAAPTASAPAKATPAATEHKACPNCGGENIADALFCEECGYDFTTGQLPPPASPIPPPVPAPAPVSLANVDWVAEIWIDPDFFAAQDAVGTCPTGGAPTVVPLSGSEVIIGRASKSAGKPDIACSGDSATSHRHAKLTLDHGRWYLEDLGSTNGTFVGTPASMPPTALVAGERHELTDSERIYIGAWTRIVIRRATADEKGTPAG